MNETAQQTTSAAWDWVAHDFLGPCWVSRIYKIVRYNSIPDFQRGRPGYAVYFIRKGDKNWGYHVNPATRYYRTISEAKAACDAHWEGVKAEAWVRVILRHLERGEQAS